MLATVFAVLAIIIISFYCIIYYVRIHHRGHACLCDETIVCQHHLPAIMKIKRQTKLASCPPKASHPSLELGPLQTQPPSLDWKQVLNLDRGPELPQLANWGMTRRMDKIKQGLWVLESKVNHHDNHRAAIRDGLLSGYLNKVSWEPETVTRTGCSFSIGVSPFFKPL